MRVVVMDPSGNVLPESLIQPGLMMPVQHYITRTVEGEPVLIAEVDFSRPGKSVWNMSALG